MNYDWAQIRICYESGETAYRISKNLGGKPTRQAITKRATREGWGGKIPSQVKKVPIVLAESLNIKSHKMTDTLLQTILTMIGMGSTESMACKAAGITQKTWIDWKHKDRRLQDAVNRARAGKLCEWIGHIDAAGEKDWKASAWLLQNSPDTRGTFGTNSKDNKLEVVINIDRSSNSGGSVIDIEASRVEEGEAA